MGKPLLKTLRFLPPVDYKRHRLLVPRHIPQKAAQKKLKAAVQPRRGHGARGAQSSAPRPTALQVLLLFLQVRSLPLVECCQDELVKAGAVPETVKRYRFAVRKERYK